MYIIFGLLFLVIVCAVWGFARNQNQPTATAQKFEDRQARDERIYNRAIRRHFMKR
ncbi:MAG TPA: hypothetical protein VG965_02480 [Patescibacteria group bacterium]|nr:hypothetical protein [Patescibacteria group bacterium]